MLSSLKLPTLQLAMAPAGHDPIGSNREKQEISDISGFKRNEMTTGRPEVAFRGPFVVFRGPIVASGGFMAVLGAYGGPWRSQSSFWRAQFGHWRVRFRLSLSVLPAVPSWMEIITSIYKLNYKGIYMVPNKILIAVH